MEADENKEHIHWMLFRFPGSRAMPISPSSETASLDKPNWVITGASAPEDKIEVAHGHSQPQQLVDTSFAWVALRRDPVRNRYVPPCLLPHRFGLPSIEPLRSRFRCRPISWASR